ncbi:MAG: cytochrome P450 [Burkholderiales bacterium]|nr:cytochrome P450 [Burkholderiales bacterium]
MTTAPTSQPSFRLRLQDLPGPSALPLLGNMHQIKRKQFHLYLENWARQFGPYFQFKLGRKTWLVLSDPNLISKVLRERPEHFRRLSSAARGWDDIMLKGVFMAEGDAWRQQRKLVMRAFTADVVQRFFPQLQQMVERLRLRWTAQVRAGQAVDLLRDLKAFALDVTIALSFGQDVNAVEHTDNALPHDIDAIFLRMAKRMTSAIPYWRYLRLPSDRAADAATLRIAHAIMGFIHQARQRLQEQPQRRLKPDNLMEAMILTRDEADSGFSDNDVMGNAMTMVLAGEDTTAHSMAWLLDTLSREPHCCAQVRAELDQVSGDDKVLATHSVVEQLPLLDAVLQESMRLKTAAPVISMQTVHDVVLEDIWLPAQTPVLLLLRHAGKQSADFKQAEEFLPQRWLPQDGAEPEATRKLLSFGGGPRLCPGRFLALQEMKMLTAMILKNFELVNLPGQTAQEMFSFTMTPSCLPVGLRLRA